MTEILRNGGSANRSLIVGILDARGEKQPRFPSGTTYIKCWSSGLVHTQGTQARKERALPEDRSRGDLLGTSGRG